MKVYTCYTSCCAHYAYLLSFPDGLAFCYRKGSQVHINACIRVTCVLQINMITHCCMCLSAPYHAIHDGVDWIARCSWYFRSVVRSTMEGTHFPCHRVGSPSKWTGHSRVWQCRE